MGLCSFDQCGKPSLARGLCNSHYGQFRRHGRTWTIRTPKGTPEAHIDWLLAHQEHSGGECLTWPFRTKPNGRGALFYEGIDQFAHRVMCRLAHGEPPSPEHAAAHSCGKGHLGCVHPGHLRWATLVENSADRLLHGTDVRGDKHPRVKLTERQVFAIRELSHTVSRAALTSLFDIKRSQVGRIIRGESWGHI